MTKDNDLNKLLENIKAKNFEIVVNIELKGKLTPVLLSRISDNNIQISAGEKSRMPKDLVDKAQTLENIKLSELIDLIKQKTVTEPKLAQITLTDELAKNRILIDLGVPIEDEDETPRLNLKDKLKTLTDPKISTKFRNNLLKALTSVLQDKYTFHSEHPDVIVGKKAEIEQLDRELDQLFSELNIDTNYGYTSLYNTILAKFPIEENDFEELYDSTNITKPEQTQAPKPWSTAKVSEGAKKNAPSNQVMQEINLSDRVALEMAKGIKALADLIVGLPDYKLAMQKVLDELHKRKISYSGQLIPTISNITCDEAAAKFLFSGEPGKTLMDKIIEDSIKQVSAQETFSELDAFLTKLDTPSSEKIDPRPELKAEDQEVTMVITYQSPSLTKANKYLVSVAKKFAINTDIKNLKSNANMDGKLAIQEVTITCTKSQIDEFKKGLEKSGATIINVQDARKAKIAAEEANLLAKNTSPVKTKKTEVFKQGRSSYQGAMNSVNGQNPSSPKVKQVDPKDLATPKKNTASHLTDKGVMDKIGPVLASKIKGVIYIPSSQEEVEPGTFEVDNQHYPLAAKQLRESLKNFQEKTRNKGTGNIAAYDEEQTDKLVNESLSSKAASVVKDKVGKLGKWAERIANEVTGKNKGGAKLK